MELDSRRSQVPDDESDEEDKEYHPKFTKAEEEYQAAALARQKAGIVKPQVVTGKEFKGTAFISKPDTILFKDFELGKPMTQTILMTNVSFSFNSFKMLPLSDEIKDFFEIVYVPSGRLSAGLSTNITITFYPHVNKDIVGVLPILAETGRIQIPLICRSQKALISLEEETLDFGDVVRGEEAKKVFKIKNSGALRTKFYFKRNSGQPIINTTISQDDGMNKSQASQQGFLQTGLMSAVQGNQEGGLLDDITDPTFMRDLDDFLKQFSFRMNGQIQGYSGSTVTVTFRPTLIGSYDEQFTLFLENQEHTEPIKISVRGVCVDVPIFVENLQYDLKVLVYDHTYREKIVLHNRSPLPMKIQLSFPRELKPYLEFNPTLGYIQGNSHFEIWLKFKPTRTLLSNASRFLVGDQGISIPIKVVGANQTIPVRFRILAVFTVDAVTMNPSALDFGELFQGCNASQIRMTMENHSLLPQKYCFFRLPREIEVVPPQGTLMPKETYEVKVRFRPGGGMLGQVTGNIVSMFITGNICTKELKIPYSVQISKSPIVFDKQKLEFPALPVGETSEIILSCINKSQKHYEIEIVPPYYRVAGVQITPVVQSLAPGEPNLISFKYLSEFRDLSPFDTYLYGDTAIEDEFTKALNISAVRNKRLEEKLRALTQGAEAQGKQEAKGGKKGKKEDKKEDKAPAKGKKGAKDAAAEQAELQAKLEEEERKRKELEDKKAEVLSRFDKHGELEKLGGKVRDFEGQTELDKSQHYEWLIPCYFREKGQIQTTQVCYFEVRSVAINKVLVADRSVCDFGEIAVSLKKTNEIVIRNTGPTEEPVRLEPLNPYGGFSVLNAVRTIPPRGKHSVILQFEPFQQQLYEDKMLIYSKRTLVSVKLVGRGVRPSIEIEPENGLINFNHVLEGDSNQRSFKLKNTSSFTIHFNFESQFQGEQNRSGLKVFTFIPSKGSIPANEEYEIKTIFSPDHASQDYFEKILVDIPNQVAPRYFYLAGCCWDRQLFTQLHFPFRFPKDEYLDFRMRKLASPQTQMLEGRRKIVIEFTKIEDREGAPPLSEEQEEMTKIRQLALGSCSLNDTKNEKNGTYEIAIGKENDKFFECDAAKGALNSGVENVIKFKFKPPPPDPILDGIAELKGVGQWVECPCELKLAGGFVTPGQPDPMIVDLVLRAYIEQI